MSGLRDSGGEPFQARLTVNVGSGDHDLAIELPAAASGSDLYRLLGSPGSGLGLDRTPPLLTNERTGLALRHDEPLVDTDLLTGDRLVSVVEPRPPPSLGLRLLTGPGRDRSLVVPEADVPVVIGRALDAGFDDRSVSRHHARLDLAAEGVSVCDLGSTNGTIVNGVRLAADRPAAIGPGDVVEVGDVSFAMTSVPPGRRPPPDDNTPFRRRGTRLEYHPAPRAADPRPPSAVTLPQPPSAPPSRRFPMGAAVLPVVMGAVMAVIFSPVFAVFMAMSPLMIIWTHVDDRRSGRRAFAAERAAFLDELEAQRLVVADTADRIAAWRRRRTPRLDQIARWVRCGATQLWARRARHDDFLTVAVGTADRVSSIEIAMPEHGASELVAAAQDVADEVGVEPAAPVVVDLGRHPVVGITGGAAATGVARAMVAQLVGLRSPGDLQIVVLAPERAAEWAWTTWLPHTGRGAGKRAIAADDAEALTLFSELEAVVEQRVAARGDRIGGGGEVAIPRIVVVVHPPVGLSPAAVSRFLEAAPSVGVSVVFITENVRGLPAEATVHVDVPIAAGAPAVVHRLAEGSTVTDLEPWSLDVDEAMTMARDLAPLVDVTMSDAEGGIPTTVTLPDLHDGDTAALFEGAAIGRRWAADETGLVATLGGGSDGPIVVDLQADGPHALVAGTTGSGKSELLQTMIADLAARYPPTHLNFILIDYKGGSAFRECERLPHTVGFVTDLDEHLAARALISLRAELRHRERVLAELEVGDLAAMRARFRHSVNADLVLPSLVIVIDEFAALRSEVPDFVDGLVDVAQRGRSMGVHMILATQKPAGVVTPQIDANTNIRVALRVASEADSRDLIGVIDAAHIHHDLPGRALLKIGGGSLVTPFQSAYVGGRSAAAESAPRSGLATLGYGMRPGPFRAVGEVEPGSIDRGSFEDETDLGAIVEAAREAWAAASDGRALRRPWLPPLAPVIDADLVDEAAGLDVAIGLADLPDAQTQVPYTIDLALVGHAVVYGASGSGKTTLLRTLACSISLAAAAGGQDVVLYGIDFGGGLRAVEALPTVAGVVAGSEPERLQLLLSMLEAEVAERLQSGPTRGGPVAERPSIVLMIDGFGPFWDVLEGFDFGRQADRFARLLSQAPSAGVHVVMTADQRSAVPFNCQGSIGLRLLQRLAAADEYRTLGLTSTPNPDSMPPGRTWVVDGPEVQVAFVDESGVAAVGDRLRARGVTGVGAPVRPLADVVRLHEVRPADALTSVAVGLGPAHDEVSIDLHDQPTLLVAGAAGSGRSTALHTLGAQLATLIEDRRVVVPKRTSVLAAEDAPFTSIVAVGVVDALVSLADEVEERARTGFDRPMVVAVDDVDLFFDDNRASAALNTLVLESRDAGVVVLMATSAFRAATAYEMWIRAMRNNGHGLVLQPDGDKEEDLFDVRFPRGSALRFPAGRGYLIARSTVRAVQVATSLPSHGSVSGGAGRMRK